MTTTYDIAIIGGSFSGLSAALLLGNAMWKVAIVDAGSPRNALASCTHNLLGYEGCNPSAFLNEAKREIQQLPRVHWVHGLVQTVSRRADGRFTLRLSRGRSISSRKLILATGVVDILPKIPGIEKFWAKNVFHCPYCSASDLQGEPLAVYSRKKEAYFLSLLLHKWSSNLTLLTDGRVLFSREQSLFLEKKQIQIYSQKIKGFSGTPGKALTVDFKNGKSFSCRGLFMHLPFEQRAKKLLKVLGCRITKQELIQVDKSYQTSLDGVFAIGDAAMAIQKVSTAIASGTVAAIAIDHQLVKEGM